MSLARLNNREHHVPAIADSPSAPMRTCRSKPLSRLALLLTAIVTLCGAFIPASAWSADRYIAFYYNGKGELLHVESVPLDEMTARQPTLVSIYQTKMPIPVLDRSQSPKFSKSPQKMSKFAAIAVYYTYAETSPLPVDGDVGIAAYPIFFEDLEFVEGRTLTTCLKGGDPNPCVFPKRCHCLTGGCCCY